MTKIDALANYVRLNFGLESIGDVVWSHATNSHALLDDALGNPEVHFIETDISLSHSGNLIAAHPPATTSDLLVSEMLAKIKLSSKGIKLDFKDQAAVLPCLKLLAKSQLKQPLMLNADVLSLPGAPAPAIHAKAFVSACRKYYPRGMLSLGWRTFGGSDPVYSFDDINRMLDLCKGLDSVTFPLRASLLPASITAVCKLLVKDSYTFTLWDVEPVSTELSQWIMQNTDQDRCFYDLTVEDGL